MAIIQHIMPLFRFTPWGLRCIIGREQQSVERKLPAFVSVCDKNYIDI